MTGAKICGLTTAETVAAAVEGGAEYLGLNFFHRSPRYLTPEAAAALASPVRGRTKLVAVTVDPSDAELDEISRALRPDLIQLHGRETPERVGEVAARTGATVIKALSVAARADLAAVNIYEHVAEHLMFEPKPPAGAALPGGNGAPLDWAVLDDLHLERPWFLAGGLNPYNVAAAVRLSGAPLVDVSSGVESAPGVKQPALITAFLDAVRRT